MNLDRVFEAFNRAHVRYLLIGGVNFMLRHAPVLTYDVDLWIENIDANRRRCELALADLDAEWGLSDDDWEPVKNKPAGWLDRQSVYCLNSPHAAIDVFLSVLGLADWNASNERAVEQMTTSGILLRAVDDLDMLRCQQALDTSKQNQSRMRALEQALQQGQPRHDS